MFNANVQAVVDILLDRPRRMRMTFGALAAIEDRTGISFLRGDSFKPNELPMRSLIALFTETLRWDDPDITDETVGNNIDLGTLDVLLNAFTTLLSRSMPAPDPTTPAAVAEAAESGNGSTPGLSLVSTSD